MKLTETEAAIEAVLFAAGEAVPFAALAEAVGLEIKKLKPVCAHLADELAKAGRGIELCEINGAFQLRTRAEFYPYIKTVFQSPTRRALTAPLMETLAIIAYRQPVTRAQIEEIRGVDASHAVNRLTEFGLVEEWGRSDQPGRPILFRTTEEFLRHYGLAGAGDLPGLNDLVLTELGGE